jgi:hypothetical protein
VGFVQRWWKRTVLVSFVQSTTESTGWGPQPHVVTHRSSVALTFWHVKTIGKQHVVGTGVPGAAVTLIHPVHPTGSGFGAGDLSSLTSVAVKPGHSGAGIVHVAGTAHATALMWRNDGPAPGLISSCRSACSPSR